MWKFWKAILIVGAGTLIVALSLIFFALNRLKDNWEYKLESTVHTLYVGNSMGENSINDKMLYNCRNICKQAESLIYSCVVIDSLLSHNQQIDTVVVTLGVPSLLIQDDDDFYSTSIQGIRWTEDRMAISSIEMYLKYFIKQKRFIPYLLTSAPHALWRKPALGGYLPLEVGDKMYFKNSEWFKEYAEKRGGRTFTKEMIERGSTVQIDGLKRIMDACHRHDCVCVILNTPLYRVDRFIEYEGYYDFLASLGDSILVADYANLSMPDSTYFADLIHLNHKGAEYLSQIIRDDGLKVQYVCELIEELKTTNKQ